MGVKPWVAPETVNKMLDSVFDKHHADRLGNLSIRLMFDESKPFTKNKMNLGKLLKVRDIDKPHMTRKIDYYVVTSSDLWHSVLNDHQREAFIDLHLSRLHPEYLPVTVIENKKKKVVKDEWGRIEYTTDLKLDAEGDPIWRVAPVDIYVCAINAEKFGLWLDGMEDFVNWCVNKKS